MVGFIKVFCAPMSVSAMALIGTSYLEGKMLTSMLDNGGIESSESISGFGNFHTSSACMIGKCSS